ncbi:unnamed protein product, partial [Rotaria sp. Silwood1]
FYIMSFRVETAPNQYTDYQIFSAARFDNIGRQFLSLVNPNYGTVPNENKIVPTENKTVPNEKKPASNDKETVPNENETATNENETESVPNENETATNENKASTNEDEIPTKQNEPIPKNMIQQPSDLCRPRQQQSSYYIANQE